MLVIISWLSDLKFGSPPPNKEQTPCLGDPPPTGFLEPRHVVVPPIHF